MGSVHVLCGTSLPVSGVLLIGAHLDIISANSRSVVSTLLVAEHGPIAVTSGLFPCSYVRNCVAVDVALAHFVSV